MNPKSTDPTPEKADLLDLLHWPKEKLEKYRESISTAATLETVLDSRFLQLYKLVRDEMAAENQKSERGKNCDPAQCQRLNALLGKIRNVHSQIRNTDDKFAAAYLAMQLAFEIATATALPISGRLHIEQRHGQTLKKKQTEAALLAIEAMLKAGDHPDWQHHDFLRWARTRPEYSRLAKPPGQQQDPRDALHYGVLRLCKKFGRTVSGRKQT